MICLTSASIKTNEEKNELDALLLAIARGDKDALSTLWHMTHSPVYSFALSILRNEEDAKDVLQDCFVHIYQGASLYRPRGNPMAWIFTITKNLCLARLRTRSELCDSPLEDFEFVLSAPEGMTSEDKILLHTCLNELGNAERQIVILHAVWGFKHREIARLLDLALPTVLSKYNRSIKKLQKLLEQQKGW